MTGRLSLTIILIGMALIGGCVSEQTTLPATSSPIMTETEAPAITTLIPSATPTQLVSGSVQDPVPTCSPQDAVPIIPVPVDTSVPIQDPMPGIRYSFNRSESGRTIVLEKGDVVEINLGYATGQPFHWIVQGSGCGIELLNDGVYSSGGDFWNNTGNYRARYRAVSPGTSVLNGKLVLKPEESGMLTFNLTMIVK
jgi:hypothetical protein